MAFGSDGTFNDVVNADYKSGVVTVGTTEVVAAAVGGTNLEDRQELIIYNKSTSTIYFGPTGVTTTNGIPIEAKETINIQMGSELNLYLIAGTAGNDVIIQEMA